MDLVTHIPPTLQPGHQDPVAAQQALHPQERPLGPQITTAGPTPQPTLLRPRGGDLLAPSEWRRLSA